VVVGSGGYAGAPPIYEANLAGIPTALLNPDAAPGKANRLLGRRVNVMFAQWEVTRQYFARQANIEALGCPVRPGFATAARQDGIERFGLDPNRRVLLVTGASQGARSINQALVAGLDELMAGPIGKAWQILHLTGAEDHAAVAAAYANRPTWGTALAYTQHMPDAMAAAELVVSRAGASTLAELTATGKASVLLPYPYGDGHQRFNAAVLDRAGAAVVLRDQIDPALNRAPLVSTLRRLLLDDRAQQAMANAARQLGTFDAATMIARRLLHLADESNKALAG
jgi:UDP-N-acetylglucosamine--N-acetylmuramyl-(pentapeptide) pyrophosphoryl-undecaprenol N-acetylglucosamine transferase